MPELTIPLNGPAYQNVDESGLDQFSSTVIDGYVNEFNWTEKRPGLKEVVNTGTNKSVHGLYWWEKEEVVIAVSQGRVWKILGPNGSFQEMTTGSPFLNEDVPVSFTDNGTTLLMANGGKIASTTINAVPAFLTDSNAPTTVSHLGFIDQYIFATVVGTGSARHSDVNAPLTWPAANLITAESNPDDLVALHVSHGEIALFGKLSAEFWVNTGDAINTFQRIPGATVQRGCLAPYSITRFMTEATNTWFWLDQNRRVVQLNGRTPVPVSLPFDSILADLDRVDDCRAFVLQANNLPLYVMTFPTARRTIVYNFLRNDWTEWGFWDTNVGDYGAYRGNVSCFAPSWNLHLVGDRSNGKIYTASRKTFQDDGQIIRTLRRSGDVTHGTYKEKDSRETVYRFKTGTGGTVTIRKNRNGKDQWYERRHSLRKIGNENPFIRDNGSGKYRSMQYEVIHSDNSDFVFVGAREDVEVIGA